jgi:hypothetical protein
VNHSEYKEQGILSLLLDQVIVKHGHQIVHSKDCDHLAAVISDQTGELISGSTIKRLFGFIKTNSFPNKYTLNLLSRFIGHDSFNNFVLMHADNLAQEDWRKITDETLHFLKAKFIQSTTLIEPIEGLELINSFVHSPKDAFALIGEGGDGKTQLLVRYVLNELDKKNILFIEAADLKLKSSDNTISNWLKAYESELDLLIVDGLEETAYKFEEVRTLFLQILQVLANKPDRLKIIIAVRPHTWLKLSETILGDDLSSHWMNVISPLNDITDVCNLPLLNGKLIKEKFPNAPESIYGMIRRPLFYAIYNRISNNDILNEWQLLFEFFKLTIWNSSHSFEKQQFIEKILHETTLGQKSTNASRKSIEELIIRYKKAFLNLTSFHIIAEQKEVNKYGRFQSNFRFGHQYYFDFFILSEILEKCDNELMSSAEYILENYEGEKRVALLKLLISFACVNDQDHLDHFFDLHLSENDHRSIFPHLAGLIINNIAYQKSILPKFVETTSGRRQFIEFWVDEASLDGYYGEMIKLYKLHVNEPQDVLFANALLYLNAYRQENKKDCETYFAEIEKINTTEHRIHPFVIGRKCMTLLLEDFRTNHTYSERTINYVHEIIQRALVENENEQTIHFAGVEHNVLHAEFITQHYFFTPNIINILNNKPEKKYFDSTNKMILLELFFHAYRNATSKHKVPYHLKEEQLDSIYVWDRKLVKTYSDLINKDIIDPYLQTV